LDEAAIGSLVRKHAPTPSRFCRAKKRVQPADQARIDEMTSGVKGDVAVKLFGDNSRYHRKAEEIEKQLKEIKGSAT